eukprot:scaffold1605_cov340-Prasinococcus_capsulatus_cf.AAC.2
MRARRPACGRPEGDIYLEHELSRVGAGRGLGSGQCHGLLATGSPPRGDKRQSRLGHLVALTAASRSSSQNAAGGSRPKRACQVTDSCNVPPVGHGGPLLLAGSSSQSGHRSTSLTVPHPERQVDGRLECPRLITPIPWGANPGLPIPQASGECIVALPIVQ